MENHHFQWENPLFLWKSSFLMGKSTISMAIFNSYVCLPEGKSSILDWDFPWNKPSSYWGTPVTLETSICHDVPSFGFDHQLDFHLEIANEDPWEVLILLGFACLVVIPWDHSCWFCHRPFAFPHILEMPFRVNLFIPKTWFPRWNLKSHTFENHSIPSGKHTKFDGKSQFLMGKSTISMAIFNSNVSLPEGIYYLVWKLKKCICKRVLVLENKIGNGSFLSSMSGFNRGSIIKPYPLAGQ